MALRLSQFDNEMVISILRLHQGEFSAMLPWVFNLGFVVLFIN